MSDAVKEFFDVLNDRLLKKPKPFDRQGVVKRVEGKTAFVRFNGSNIETPVQLTIDCKPGDTVQTRVAGKNAWLVGNLTAPPTDDRVAKEAKAIARNVEKKTTEKFVVIDGLIDEQGNQIVLAIESANGKNTIYHSATPPTGSDFKEGDTWFDTDDDNKIYKWNGSAWSPVLLGDDALESISANKITAGEIDASQITVSNLDAGNITAGKLKAQHIDITDLLQVGNIATDSDIPTKVSDLNNDSGFVTADGIVLRNLLKNGYWDADFKNNIKSWTKESSAVIDYDASTDLYKISYPSNTAYGLYQDITVESGVQYVVSASVGSNFHLGIGTSGYPDDSGGWSTAPDGRKYKIFNSWSTTMRVYAYAKADTCYINRIKVEKGSTYTGWYDDNTKDLSSKYLKFDTTNGLDIGYSGTNAKVNIDGQNVNIYNSNGYIGNILYPNGMRVMDGQGGSAPVFEVYANSDWSNYAKSGSASFQSAYSPAPYIANISCSGTVVGVGSVWAQNQQGTDISDYCYWKYISSSNKIQVYISRDYSGPTPATAYATYWVQTPARAYVGVNPSNPSNYLFVVGNGTASRPSNALSVDGFGNFAAKGYANFDRGVIASSSIDSRSYLDIDVNFNKTFESVPTVVATLCSSSTSYQIGYVSCSVLANSITKQKFTLRLFNADTTSRAPAVYWMATDAK